MCSWSRSKLARNKLVPVNQVESWAVDRRPGSVRLYDVLGICLILVTQQVLVVPETDEARQAPVGIHPETLSVEVSLHLSCGMRQLAGLCCTRGSLHRPTTDLRLLKVEFWTMIVAEALGVRYAVGTSEGCLERSDVPLSNRSTCNF